MKRRKAWSDAEIDILKTMYPNVLAVRIAAQLDRPVSAIYAKAALLGLSKSDEFYATEGGRLDGVKGAGTRFQKGQVSWNKGTHFAAGGKSVETRFKPGTRQGRADALYKPIGTERVTKDGYLQRKVNDDMPLQRRWKMVHVIEWEAVNGPLPKGHVIVFRDGNRQNVDLANLEVVSRRELMNRNTVHNLPKPVAQLVQLRGALIRKINRVERAK